MVSGSTAHQHAVGAACDETNNCVSKKTAFPPDTLPPWGLTKLCSKCQLLSKNTHLQFPACNTGLNEKPFFASSVNAIIEFNL